MDATGAAIALIALFFLIVPVFAFERRPKFLLILGVALSLRVAFVLFNTYVSTRVTDDFEGMAANSVMYGWSGMFEALGPNSALYKSFCTAVYLVFGRNPLLLQFINVALSIYTILIAIRLTDRLTQRKFAEIVGWTLTLFPISIIFSSVILREAFVVFPAMLGISIWAAALKENNVLKHALALGCFFVAFAFHYGCLAFIIAWAMLPAIYQFMKQKNLAMRIFMAAGLGTASLSIVVLLYFTGVIDALMPKGELSSITAEGIGDKLQHASRDRAAYLSSMTVTSPASLVWQLPIRMVFLNFTPFPWMVTAVVDVVGLLDAFFYITLFYIIFTTRRFIITRPLYIALLGCYITCIAMFSIGTSNYGTAMRHRAKFMPILVIVAAAGLHHRREFLGYRHAGNLGRFPGRRPPPLRRMSLRNAR